MNGFLLHKRALINLYCCTVILKTSKHILKYFKTSNPRYFIERLEKKMFLSFSIDFIDQKDQCETTTTYYFLA